MPLLTSSPLLLAIKVNLIALVRMLHPQLVVLLLSILLFPLSLQASEDPKSLNSALKSSVFLSPPFFLQPGSVANKYYFDIPFPRGHLALKRFNAEVVDETGSPVPLHETYLHHWVVEPYYGLKGATFAKELNAGELDLSKIILKRNNGICNRTLGQYFGLGSETRKTDTWVPDPYGIEIGKAEDAPDGYEERWMLNVHAIDTRGVQDRLGCTECKCSLYNVTVSEYGHPIGKDYVGGLYCCYDQRQCLTKEGFNGGERKLYLRYTVQWVDWDESIVPVKIYIFDVTDSRGILNGSTDGNVRSSTCKVEYEVKPCSLESRDNGECVDNKKVELALPHGGDIVYGVAHQHTGGIGSALYGQDGRVLCSSMPTYGKGQEVGDEAGYIVGMSTCYPKPGSVKVADGELLTLVSNYSNSQHHTGVMGLFYILVAEPQPKLEAMSQSSTSFPWMEKLPKHIWTFAFMGGLAVIVVGVFYRRRDGGDYQPLIMT